MAVESRIRVLPTHVANKIAAGEVVERPASVVKELVENSLDAGATQIDIEITAGGRKLIAITDNGCGMNRDDALLSVERQATSKIRDVDDIEHIATLGFRGEALAAISSVSRFRLLTCARGEMEGTEVLVAAGRIQQAGAAGTPAGTRIEVRDLFVNVPARRKFLRTYATELSHIRAVFLEFALCYPAAGLSLTVDGRNVYRLAGGASLDDRMRELFGADILDRLCPVARQSGPIRISGYTSRPGFSRPDRNEQYVFVNGRPTSAPVIPHAVREAYHTLLARDRHPSLFLFIEVPPEDVDVNVHPTKREVRFRRSMDVRDAVIAALGEALGNRPGDVPATGAAPVPTPPPAPRPRQLVIDNLPEARSFRYPVTPRPLATESPPLAGGDRPGGAESPPPAAGGSAAPRPAGPPPPLSPGQPDDGPWSWCRVVGIMAGRFVVMESEDGMILMDPRAAHERVLFERYLEQVGSGAIPSQSLLIPSTVPLRPKDALCVRRHLDRMKALGFGIAEFGGDSFVVDALPACFSGAAPEVLLPEIASALEQATTRKTGPWIEEALARAASRSAVGTREKLRLEEIEQLVVDLSRARMPYTCPQGKPTIIFTSFRELNRKFGRE